VPRLLAPRLLGAHLLALVLVAAAVALGVWQYDAWQTRRELDARDVTRLEPVPLASVLGPDDPFPGDRVGQPVVVEGTWVPGGTVFVSGREHEGHPGYWVVTPLAVGGAGQPALPIVRGWVDEVADAPPAPTGDAELVAWLQPTEGTGEQDSDPTDDVYPQLRIADLVQRVDQDLYGGYAVVADDVVPGSWPTGDRAVNDGTAGLQPAGLEQLPDAGRFTALRNLLYAIEWWFFGAFAAFIWWRWVMDQEADARAAATAEIATDAADDRSDVTP
jgi:cytochrome oxidase assembly protein ShyY1